MVEILQNIAEALSKTDQKLFDLEEKWLEVEKRQRERDIELWQKEIQLRRGENFRCTCEKREFQMRM